MLSLTGTQTDTRLDDIAPAFRVMRTRNKLGEHTYPTNEDYYEVVSAFSGTPSLAEVAPVAAQRDWFQRGQTGCHFARMAANLSLEAWPYVVWDGEQFDAFDAGLLDARLDVVAEADGVEMVSLIFPRCESILQLRDIALELALSSKFWIEDIQPDGEDLIFQIRRSIGNGVNAWVMGFGPDGSFPTTRRAPYYELAVRTKAKPEVIYGRLNQDRDVAHLADFPLDMKPEYWDHRWDSTEKRTREILGHEPDQKSAARSTFSVPRG